MNTSYKLNKPWYLFNRLISIQIPECPNECWHCYLPHELYIGASRDDSLYQECTAEEIIDSFIQQKKFDLKLGKFSNVLRISGGEPFIAPKLILECLKLLREKNLESDVFLWTETNLEPFIGNDNDAFMDSPDNKSILKELGESNFKNFLVHPCFHGLDMDEFNNITGRSYNVTLENQIDALKKLFDSGIDLYPTIGSNVCNPSNLTSVFEHFMSFGNDSLPLKTGLIEYDLERYPPIRKRLVENQRKPKLYSKYASLRIWNELLIKYYGIGYGILPRHLASSVKIMDNKLEPQEEFALNQYHDDEILYLFKSSYRMEYHNAVLEVIAYPKGHIYELSLDKKWGQKDLIFHIDLFGDAYKNTKGILLYADPYRRKFIPVREFTIIEIEIKNELIHGRLELGDYITIDGNENHLNESDEICNAYRTHSI